MTATTAGAGAGCAARLEALGTSAFGTAPEAGSWVALEQAGPWGHDAIAQSRLPEGLGPQLARRCSDRGGRLLLVRAPGRHADDHGEHGRTAYLAHSGTNPWLLHARGIAPQALLEADMDALAAGDLAAVRASLPAAVPCEPVLLVCTNGRRDLCCAVRGRPVAVEAARVRPGQVWEASHTGGHRFAPTGVVLPHGLALARLDTELALDVLAGVAHGRLPRRALGPRHDRGRSGLPPAAQAAESWVRHQTGEGSLAALHTRLSEQRAPDGVCCEVTHTDGRRWSLVARRLPSGHAAPESCGRDPVPVLGWDVGPVSP